MPKVHPVSIFVAPLRKNKRQELLDSAAQYFAMYGYDRAALRDIAMTAGMKAGSIYYYFTSKEDLLVAVHEEGIRRISSSVKKSLKRGQDPWQRLEAAMIAHLEALLGGGNYVWVVIKHPPKRIALAGPRLIRLRDDYERIFVNLISALPLFSPLAKKYVRLMILGAMNSTPTWYSAGGDEPEEIAKAFVQVLRYGETP